MLSAAVAVAARNVRCGARDGGDDENEKDRDIGGPRKSGELLAVVEGDIARGRASLITSCAPGVDEDEEASGGDAFFSSLARL